MDRRVHERDPQPYWHCGQKTVVIDVPANPDVNTGLYSMRPQARQCQECGALSYWSLTELPPPGGMGSPDYGWGLWTTPPENPTPGN